MRSHDEWWDAYRDDDVPHAGVRVRRGESLTRTRPGCGTVCAMDDVADHRRRRCARARRAYYGAISYVDDQIGRLIDVLRQTGRLDNTVVILTSDHGDMLGERGLWYKMSFFEGSVRVPLVVSAPGRFAPGRVSAPVSHDGPAADAGRARPRTAT